jgi:hypothetical protein
VSLIQVGRNVFAPEVDRGCFVRSLRSTALLPNVAGMLLPSGVAAIHYSVKGRVIRWSTVSAGKFQPHGSVTVNRAGRIVSATVYSGPGVPLRAVVTYLGKAPAIVAPRKLCRA